MAAAGGDQPGAVRGRAVHQYSSSSPAWRPTFLVFCKGRVVIADDDDEDSGTPDLAVVVCGPQGVVLRGHKPVPPGFEGGHGGDGDDAGQVLLEAMALVEGLHIASKMRIARVKAITDHKLLHDYMLGLSRPTEEKLAAMINQARLSMQKQFEQYEISLVTDGHVKNVVNVAEEVLDDEVAKYLATKEKTENCMICFEDVVTTKFHKVEGCAHRFCLVCMKKHMEVTLLGGMAPGCPQFGCSTKLTVEGSKSLISRRLREIMAQRLKEEDIHIPPSQRVYCPYPKCSALMSLREVEESFCSEYPTTFRECVECGHPMCMNCKVAWHERMSCLEYQKRYPHGDHESQKLQKLARRQKWKRCERCNHMIELGEGCSHIICACGNQLCYNCGNTLDKDGNCDCTGLTCMRRRRCFQLPTCWGGMCH